MEELTGKEKKFVREHLMPKYPTFSFGELCELFSENKDNVYFTHHEELKEKLQKEEKMKSIVDKRRFTIYKKRFEKSSKRADRAFLESRKDELFEHSKNYLDHDLNKHVSNKYIDSPEGMNLINHFRKHEKLKNKYDNLKKVHNDLVNEYNELTESVNKKQNRMSHAISYSKQEHKEKREVLYQQLLKQYYDFKVKLDKPIYNFIMMLLGIIRSG